MIETSISDQYADCGMNFVRNDCIKRIEIFHKIKHKFVIYVWTYDLEGREDRTAIVKSGNGRFVLTNASLGGGLDFK